MNKKGILEKLDRAKNLPTLPAVALKVNEMLKDYNASVDQLTKVIENDQAIVLKLLRLVNSAFYGFKSKIKDIPHAVTLMGYNTLRNAVISVSIIDAFKIKSQVEGFEIQEFWAHSIEVAVFAKYFAKETRLYSPEEAFTLGLLHDMGKLVQLIVLPDLFTQIITEIQTKKIAYQEAEKTLGIMGHGRVGAYLAEKWLLPEEVADVIKYHHTPKRDNKSCNQMALVHVADIFAHATRGAEAFKHNLGLMSEDIKKCLMDAFKSKSEWYPKAKAEIQIASQFFMKE